MQCRTHCGVRRVLIVPAQHVHVVCARRTLGRAPFDSVLNIRSTLLSACTSCCRNGRAWGVTPRGGDVWQASTLGRSPPTGMLQRQAQCTLSFVALLTQSSVPESTPVNPDPDPD